MAEKKEFEIKLSEDETYRLVSTLTDFYEDLETIQDYFLERKKEKVVDMDWEKYSDEFFNDLSIEPKDMDITVEVIDGKHSTHQHRL